MSPLRLVLVSSLVLAACKADELDGGAACRNLPPGVIQVSAGASALSGNLALVVGTTVFAPGLNSPDAGILTELAVNAVYVGGSKVTAQDFNFRSWSAILDAAHLCAASVELGNQREARLALRVYLSGNAGVCYLDVPEATVVLPLPAGFCTGLSVPDAGVDGGTAADGGADGG